MEHADTAGLVRGAQSAPGTQLSVRVTEVDRVLRRFAAEVA